MKRRKCIVFKALLMLVAMAYSVNTTAQTEKNVIFRAVQGEITYKEPEKKEPSKGILGALVDYAKSSIHNTEHHPEFVENVRAAIAGAVGNARRVSVVDASALEGMADDEAVLLFDGSIGSITTSSENYEETDSKGKKHEGIRFNGVITATINIKDAHNGEILTTIPINNLDYSFTWVESAEKALGNALQNVRNKITAHLNLAYPLYASIIEGERAKKDKQKEVYIDLGELDGAFKGMTFNVYTVKVVAGREAKKEIGRLKIEEVMGDDVSLCKVTKGGLQIKECIDNGDELLITSTN